MERWRSVKSAALFVSGHSVHCLLVAVLLPRKQQWDGMGLLGAAAHLSRCETQAHLPFIWSLFPFSQQLRET